MSGAAVGPGWWDDAADGDDPGPAPIEPPLDSRTTQPMPPVDRSGGQVSSPAHPQSSSPETVRVEAPAWFLHAQKRAAEQNRADDPIGRAPGAADSEPLETGSLENASIRRRADAEPATFLDPTVAASYRPPTPPRDLVAGSIGLLGAAMLCIGSFLIWGRSTGIVEATVTGVTGSNGWGTLACGVVVGLGAVLVSTGRRSGLVGGAMLIAALAAVYLCGFSAVDILRTGDELPDIFVGAGVDRATAETATLELAGGFAVVAAGAAAALAAGTIAFARRV